MVAQLQYNTGILTAPSLTGSELVEIDTGGAVKVRTSTGAIASLSGSGTTTDFLNTPITTVGNGTLTAAALIGGVITRTGPVAAYTDTTDSAANILTAIGTFVLGATITFIIKNGTEFAQTISAGSGVTLPATNIIGPFQEGEYFGVIGGTSAAPTITVNHILTTAIGLSSTVSNPAAVALNTVGAGTITAAGINAGATVRGGSQTNTAFTDTTDIAANIIAGNPGLIGKIGASFLYWYENTTNANATLTGGTGVTVSGITLVPGGTSALYLVTYTAAATITMVGLAQTVPATATGTFIATGATGTTVTDSRITANSVVDFGLKTVGGTIAGAPYMSAVTAGTNFVVKAGASDTSTYNYRIVG